MRTNGFNRVVSLQAVNKQITLEQHLQTLRESDHMLQTLQDSLEELDKQLTTYLTDRVDAVRMPQEAQVSQQCPVLINCRPIN